MNAKLERLCAIIAEYDCVAVAYSGGVDSTFLAAVAHDVLGSKALCITTKSCLQPAHEFSDASAWCQQQGMRQVICEFDPFSIEGFERNPKDRCYLCKRRLYGAMEQAALREGVQAILDGSNVDDTKVYRPGRQALTELGIRSPMVEAGLIKAEIRELSHEMGLGTWNRPSFACLASRFAYGETLTPEALARVEAAEGILRDAGFAQYRVRVHGDLARIEVLPEELPRLIALAAESGLAERIKSLGFKFVTCDLEGFRSGSFD